MESPQQSESVPTPKYRYPFEWKSDSILPSVTSGTATFSAPSFPGGSIKKVQVRFYSFADAFGIEQLLNEAFARGRRQGVRDAISHISSAASQLDPEAWT